MNLDDFDCESVMNHVREVVQESQERTSQKILAEQNYKAALENSIFQTRDALLKMQEDSEKESDIATRRFIIQTVLSVASLIVAVIAAVASIIALL